MRRLLLTLLISGVTALAAPAQNPELQIVPVAPGVHMLVGRGGNIGVLTGDDGAFLIDDQFAPVTPQIEAAIAKIGRGPIRFVINTHWHGDHTGGNEVLGEQGALIVAHDNVRERMSSDQFIAFFNSSVPASPAGALPVVTFNDEVSFYVNGEKVHAFHVEAAHTDSDAIVHFEKANAFHLGDVFFTDGYPFIDLSSGGSIEGVIQAVERVLAMADADTKLMPGHGSLGSLTDLRAYRDMLTTARDRIRKLATEGNSVEQVVAARPTADLDERWGQSFIKPDQFIRLVYDSLK